MDQLEYLIEISKNRSLNAAAGKLHITQQALSTSIKTLEEELGFEVLYRSYQGVSLTPRGAQLVKMTINYLDKVEKLKNSVSKTADLEGQLTIHSCHIGQIFFFPRLLRMFYEDAPKFKLIPHYDTTEKMIDAVLNDELELCFCTQSSIKETPVYPLTEALTYVPLCHHKLYCRVPRIYPLSGHQSTSIKNLLNYPLIFYTATPNDDQHSFIRIVNEFARPKKTLISSDISFCREMVDSSNCIELFIDLPNQNPYHNLSKNCVTLAINDDIQFSFGYAYKEMPSSALNCALLDYIHDNLARILEP